MNSLGIQLVIKLLQFYRATLSPDHGLVRGFFPLGVCRYTPTCSQFCEQALRRHGWRGLRMGLLRIGRCHPWGGAGHDPVPTAITPRRSGGDEEGVDSYPSLVLSYLRGGK